jgi:hypothetical protein
MQVGVGYASVFLVLCVAAGLVLPLIIHRSGNLDTAKARNEQLKKLADLFFGLAMLVFGFGLVQPTLRAMDTAAEVGAGVLWSTALGLILVLVSQAILRYVGPEK